jgi:hypothetical protein
MDFDGELALKRKLDAAWIAMAILAVTLVLVWDL